MKTKENIKRYRNLSIHYFENAIHFIEIGEVEKASEFLWGSLSQALKAVAAIKDIRLRSHDDIKNYAMELSKELKDEGIWFSFIEAQGLHSNFYESGLKVQDVSMAAENIKRKVTKLLDLIPREALK